MIWGRIKMQLRFTHRENQTFMRYTKYLENLCERTETQIHYLFDERYAEITAFSGNDRNVYIINEPQAIKNTMSNESMQEILALNGILFDVKEGEIVNRSYSILVFEFSIISVKQTAHAKNGTQSKYIDEEQCSKICDIAKRAIYLVGLDYGMVHVVVNGQRRVRISGIDASPELREKDIKAITKKLERIIRKAGGEKKSAKMGADPEFMIANSKNGRMISASDFFPREGIVGCDNIRIPSRQQRPIAEIRPKPDESPLELLNNIKQALNTAKKLAPYRNTRWLAGSQPFNGYAIGGHIHFSNVEFGSHLLRALDTYLALPVFLIEDQETAVKRRKKYGFLADYRLKEYGGFEYRTLGSWLVSEDIALAVLCLANIVANNYHKLTRNCFVTALAQKAFYEGDQAGLRHFFDDIWVDLTKLDCYQDYQEHLQVLYDLIKSESVWDEKKDFRKVWSLATVQGKNYVNNRMVNTGVGSRASSSSASRTNPGAISGSQRISSSSGSRTRATRTSVSGSTASRSISSVRVSHSGSGRVHAR